MSRPSKEEQAKREGFVRKYFEGNPDATVGDANGALKERYEQGMTAARIQKIRCEVGGVSLPSVSPQDEVLLYKQVEEFVRSATSRIRGLRMLKIKINDDGKVVFDYLVDRPVKGQGSLDI